ncbi:ATP-dependent DNA ligase [Nanoarchaeota archaeon]
MKYLYLVNVYQRLDSTTKRLEKTHYISKLLQETEIEDLPQITQLLQGRVFPPWDDRKIGVAAKLVLKAINVASGIDAKKIENEWKKTGDLGIAAENLIGKKKQATLFSQNLTVNKVFSNLQKLASLEGIGSVDRKIKLIAELLTSSQAQEAKYIVRTVLEELRVGVADGSLRDAIAWAYLPKVSGIFFRCKCGELNPANKICLKCGEELNKKYNAEIKTIKEDKAFKENEILEVNDVSEIKELKGIKIIISKDEKSAREIYNYLVNLVQEAYDVVNDFGEIARIAKTEGRGGLLGVELETLKPIKVMLYQKAKGIADAFETVGKPAAFEYKYDGFRLQIHKKGDEIKLYTRSLEDVTAQFPDVVDAIKSHTKSNNFILDAEAIGVDPKTGKYKPFQQISQRIKRKYDIDKLAKEVPIIVNVFDAIEIDGKNLIKTPLKERREKFCSIIEATDIFRPAEQLVTDDEEKAQEFYEKALKLGNEGVMAKNLDSPYKPGSRVGHGVKVKPVMETLDCVIVGAEWGEGKRSQWLSSFTIAVVDEDTGEFVEIGKVGTGIKELEESGGVTFQQMTDTLKPLIITEKGKEVSVHPKIVVEINYEEIQKSPTYSSGYALRFPRVVNLRTDKPADEASSVGMVEDLYHGQK